MTSETLSLARNWRCPDQPANSRSMLRLVNARWMGNCCGQLHLHIVTRGQVEAAAHRLFACVRV